LARASQEARTVVTADLDYSRLLALGHVGAPSLILFRGGNWNETDIIARMRELLQGLSETDIEQSILIVDRQRVRRRRLPLLS
jgi:predicted nuclease of predicted toxin-antitoxin system